MRCALMPAIFPNSFAAMGCGCIIGDQRKTCRQTGVTRQIPTSRSRNDGRALRPVPPTLRSILAMSTRGIRGGRPQDTQSFSVHHRRTPARRGRAARARKPQRISAAARDILLVTGGAMGRAHHALRACGRRPLLLHLTRALKPPPAPGQADQSSTVFNPSARRPADNETARGHPFWRIDDLARVEHIAGIEAV